MKLWIFVLAAAAAVAQTPGAVLSGMVANSSGAGVPSASISAKNVATGQTSQALSDAAGSYRLANLAPGDYEISVSAAGFAEKTTTVTVAAGAVQTLNLALAAGGLSLGDLGFTPEQSRGSAADQARLDRRSHMLKIHQRLGLITTAPLIATLITGAGAGGRKTSSSERDLHAALGSVTAGLYITTASFAIFAPKIPGNKPRGPIRLHRTLAWIHGPGMILTPVLGALAYQQKSRGEHVHGLAQAHGPVAVVTGIAYGLAIASVSIKF